MLYIPPRFTEVWAVRNALRVAVKTQERNRMLVGTLRDILKDAPRTMRESTALKVKGSVRVRRAK